uniref:ATP-dependent Clp protease n=1 Tax=Prototheca miyajii TaxID=2034260 RepID=UPI003001072D
MQMPVGVPKVPYIDIDLDDDDDEEDEEDGDNMFERLERKKKKKKKEKEMKKKEGDDEIEEEEEEEEEEEIEWIDLYQFLYRERVLFLCHELQEELANQLIGLIMYLSEEDPTFDMFLYINSLGGSAICGLGVYDAINFVEAKVTTICAGVAASTAALVLTGGERGERVALPHARIMLHQPESDDTGQGREMYAEAREVRRVRQQIGILFSDCTGQPLNKVSADLDRDVYMSALDARFYGLVDKIVISIVELGRY